MRKGIIFLTIISIPCLLLAETSSSTSLWGLFRLGGIWMWFLLILSVISAGFIFEKLYSFNKAKLKTKEFFPEFEKLLRRKDFTSLKEFFETKGYLISDVLSRGFHEGINTEEFERRIERASSIEVNELGRGLNILATIGSIAPLIGFLGTVAGMIAAFGNIAAADDVSAQLVAGGIYTALTTTAYGLIVSIPSIAMYNYFVHRIDNFVADVEKVVNMILDKDIIK
ncbi:MAG: MotA/TolQ/ExbB proton channel family protein [Endomicrobiales bacterium]|nr:MotA/TolQ/ExbB proton channel family protein [Endomicrobiales bacterium]